MRLLLLLAAFLVAGAFSQRVRNRKLKIQNAVEEKVNNKRVVCYYTNWSIYRKGLAKYAPGNINPYLCTHLIYAFGSLTDDFGIGSSDPYQDIEQGGYAKFNGLKQYNKGMKTLLAIGGWNEGSGRFSELVADPQYRQNFTESTIRHLRRYNFDGLDLDWEYPASRKGSMPEDKQNYATLVKELREAFEVEGSKVAKGRLLLTMAVPAGKSYIDKGYDVPTLDRYLDFFNILSYDYHSVYEPLVNHHASLYRPPGSSEFELNANLNIDWTVNYYLKKGASRSKLVVGIPTYGRSFTLLDGQFNELGSSADGPGTKGKYTNEKGYLAFYEVCEYISVDGWKVAKPYPNKTGPIAYKGNQWVGYDDEKIVAIKAEYVRDELLGGIMFWTLDSDDFRGVCNGEQYPLIEAAKEALFKPSATSANEARALVTGASEGNRLTGNQGTRRRPGSRTTPAPIIDPYNTPEPPTTPASVKGYQCKREGYFPNPDNCHKYFWCLDASVSGLGIVPHAFTCAANLMFSKTIGGCDQPQNVKCKTQSNRGGADVTPPTTTPFPRTTPFDESLLPDYNYIYDDYYYYEDDLSVLEEIDEFISHIDPVKENSIIQNSRGSGQFKDSKTVDDIINTVAAEEEAPIGDLGSVRTRPEYTSIQRDRVAAEPEIEYVDEESLFVEPIVNNGRTRPQYSSVDRRRPSVASRHDEEVIQDLTESTTDRDSLNYVTLDRGRKPSTQPSVSIDDTTVDSGPEYVTIRRSRPASTADPALEFLDLIDYYDEQLIETTTETITVPPTTARQIRIRIPTRRTTPARQRPTLSANQRRRLKARSTTTTTTTIAPTTTVTEIATVKEIEILEVLPEEKTIEVTTKLSHRRRIPQFRRPRPQRLPVSGRQNQAERRIKLAKEKAEREEKLFLEKEIEAASVTTESSPEDTGITETMTVAIPIEELPSGGSDVEIGERTVVDDETQAESPIGETLVDEVFNLFKQQSDLPAPIHSQEATTTRSEIVEELSTFSPTVEESNIEEVSKIESSTIPIEVEKTITTVRPRTRRPITFRPNLRPRPVTPAVEEKAIEEFEGRDFDSSPNLSFTDILSGSKPSSDVTTSSKSPPRRFSLRPTSAPKTTTSIEPTLAAVTEIPIVAETDPPTTSTTTRRIPVITSARPVLTTERARQRRPPQPRTTTRAPIQEYEYVYYDDIQGELESSIGHFASLTEKAIVLPDGSVECYDTGYFPHPESCKMFISCSKTVRGPLRGWTYTCPQDLVFDPVGGMCNWAESVDCLFVK